MRDERMLDDYLRELVTQTPQDLIGKKSFQGILGTAHLLPGSVVLSTFGFECPLSSKEAEADFLVSFQKKNNGPFLLKLSAEKNFRRSAVWNDVGKLADFWAGKQLIDDFWLEFDIQGEAPLVPSLFFRPLYNSLAELEIILHYSLSALTGNESTAQLSSQVLQLVALLPDRARIFQIGAMRSRPVHGIRLCIHEISLDAILTFLKKIPYPGSVDELKEILIFLQPLVHDVAFSIDLSEGIGAKIGLECYVNPNFSAVEKQSAWTKMIDKFAEHDLIDAAKSIALKEFGVYTATGQLFKELPEELVRAMALMERHAVSTMWQYLHHLKITYDPGRPLLAKAYLSVQHTWC